MLASCKHINDSTKTNVRNTMIHHTNTQRIQDNNRSKQIEQVREYQASKEASLRNSVQNNNDDIRNVLTI